MNIHVQPPGAAAAGQSTPMEIAHHELFTAREKIELLRRLKADATAENADPAALGFDIAEIDAAIEVVKHGAGATQDAETVLRGDF